MPQSANVAIQNKFTKGLVTEATGLTFPEDACTDTINCEFDHLGQATRRVGFNYEGIYSKYSTSVGDKVVASYLWNNVGGDGDQIFTVVQIGNNLHFYKVAPDASLSSSKHATVIDLLTFVVSGVVDVSDVECQFTSGNGRLFVTHRRLNSFYVEYDVAGNTLSTHLIDIQIRDFQGDLTDPLAVDARPAVAIGALTAAHRYNLENQGWTLANLTAWDTARTDMPSNSDVSWYFKSATDTFDFTTVNDRSVGTSAAPKGHFVYNVYNINRSSKVASAVDEVITQERFTTNAFHAGRVFYAGLKVSTHTSRIYFSQVIEDPSQYGKCYQTNDPTSEKLFDELPTDGGVIDILDAGFVLKMLPMQNALMVFATNGIWAITGSQGIGFAATDYSINKISSNVNISHTSFVDVEGTPYWWNLEGIYTISLDRQTNSQRVQPITDGAIRKFYLAIPSESKQFVRGAYDPFRKKVYWIYRSGDSESLEDKYTFDSLLVLNTLTGGFYPWSVSVAIVKVKSIVNVLGLRGHLEAIDVYSGEDQVVDGAAEDEVFAYGLSGEGVSSLIKYVVSTGTNPTNFVTFAENFDTNYRDWHGEDGVGVQYESFFITGYSVRGQGMRRFQEDYLSIFSRTEESSGSFKITSRWDYATDSSTGRWSTSQLCLADKEGYTYKRNRIRIRGHGFACQFKIVNNDRNPFFIIGWSVYETGNQKP